MAVDFAAIEAAVRGICDGSLGVHRTVAVGRLKATNSADTDIKAKGLEVKEKDRFDVEVMDRGDADDALSKNHTKALTEVEVVVTVWTRLRHARHLHATRAAKHMRAETTMNLIRHALEYPNNLDDDGTDPTNLISGLLVHFSTTPTRAFAAEQVARTRMVFRGTVIETLAVS